MLLPLCHQTDQAGFSICSPRVAGKTTAVVEIILQEVKRGNKVRLSSFAEFLDISRLQTLCGVLQLDITRPFTAQTLHALYRPLLHCTDITCTV